MAIYFYLQTEKPYGVFSNFSPHGFERDGQFYPTSEHYFQAQKFAHSPRDFEAVLNASKPMRCAEIGRERHRPLRSDWETVKDEIMRQALQAKFTTHAELRELLLATGDEPLIEKTSNDYYWGCGTDGTGKNRLGELLMELRSQFLSKTAS